MKYRRHPHFLRKLREIDSYQIYIEHRDIVELSWEQVKTGPNQDLVRLRPLFKATGYYDLMLLNATAQAAISHHLDDELSKQTSVAINTAAAADLTGKSRGALPSELAKRTLKAMLDSGVMCGTPKHIAPARGGYAGPEGHGR